MKNPKYHVYLTNEERSEVLKSLIDLKNDMIARGKYTDVIDEVITKLYNARKPYPYRYAQIHTAHGSQPTVPTSYTGR